MNTVIKTARQFALSLALVSALAGSGIVAHAEGGGVGGAFPPPKLIVQTPNYGLYDNGMRVYNDGTILYADGTRGHI